MRLVVYDLDGTLVDTREDIALAVNHMLKSLDAPALPQAVIGGFVGRGLDRLAQSCLGTEDVRRIEKGAKIYRDYYGKHMLDNTRLYPGALELLNFFKGRKQVVITNKPNPFSRDILIALGVSDFFSDIVAGDSDFPKKPDPSAVVSILQRERIEPAETLFVGDSSIDIETGRRVGAHVVVVTHGFTTEKDLLAAHPDAIVPNFSGLLKLAQSKGW